VNDLLATVVWAAMAARIAFLAFWGQAARLVPLMRNVRKQLVPLSLVLIGFSSLGQAHSMPQHETGGTSLRESRGVAFEVHDGISLDEAVARAEQQYRARVVRTEVQDEDGRKVYVLKLLSEDGRVITVRIDAATGRMR
jgi:Peptidase propeptide and YPEB domain